MSDTAKRIDNWHRRGAQTLGQMSTALARRRLPPHALRQWALVLGNVAREMEEHADKFDRSGD